MKKNIIFILAVLIAVSGTLLSRECRLNESYSPFVYSKTEMDAEVASITGELQGKMARDGSNADDPVTIAGRVNAGTVCVATTTVKAGNVLTVAGNQHNTGKLEADTVYVRGTRVLLASGTNYFLMGAGNETCTGGSNTAVGSNNLKDLTSGGDNTAFGSNALRDNTSGGQNTAFGSYALRDNTSGGSNVAVGSYALRYNTSGGSNVAVGSYALRDNTSGDNNTAVGSYALRYNTSGGQNTAFGAAALCCNTSGGNNVAVGRDALYSNTSGGNNVAVGAISARYKSDGSTALASAANCIYLGANTRSGQSAGDTSTVTNEIVIGYNAIGHGSNTCTVGNMGISKTVLRAGTCIATNTVQSGYACTIGGANSLYAEGNISAESFTDRSDAPADLAEAYAIIQSHETSAGRVNHSKLHPAAWGTKARKELTGKTITVYKQDYDAEGEPVQVAEEQPEYRTVVEPDQSKRNLSMVISAQAMVIQDLQRRIEALETGRQ